MGSAQSAALDVGSTVYVVLAVVGHGHLLGYLAQVGELLDSAPTFEGFGGSKVAKMDPKSANLGAQWPQVGSKVAQGGTRGTPNDPR